MEQAGFFTYYTALGNNPVLRVGIFHPSISTEMHATYEIGAPVIIYPSDLERRVVDEIHPVILKKLVIPHDDSEFQATINRNLSVVSALIRTLKPRCPSISNRLQFGIHKGNQKGISNLLDLNDLPVTALIHLE
jgi:hypothetical protein